MHYLIAMTILSSDDVERSEKINYKSYEKRVFIRNLLCTYLCTIILLKYNKKLQIIDKQINK